MQRALLIACLCLAGCASKPVVYHAPDSTALIDSGKRLGESVAKASKTQEKERLYFAAASKGARVVTQRLADTALKLDALWQNAPIELREEVAAIRTQVADAQQELASTNLAMDEVQKWQLQLAKDLEQAIKDRNAHTVEQEAFIEQANLLAAKATTESDARAKAENEARALKNKSLSQRIITAVGVLGGLALVVFFVVTKILAR